VLGCRLFKKQNIEYFKMESLKIDRTKLVRISTYAKQKGLTPQRIYQLRDSGDLKITEIDGVQFIELS
jgi:hypothetical protein